jgi:hypothetical protein
MPNRQPQKVTVEDLLRLKRTERPSAEFWAGFERELRAKQLAALVSRRPWWDVSWARVQAGLVRVVAPLGAAAALTLAFLSFNEAQPVTPIVVTRPAPVVASLAPAATSRPAEPQQIQRQLVAPEPQVLMAESTPAPQPVAGTAVQTNQAGTGARSPVVAPLTPWAVSGASDQVGPVVVASSEPLPNAENFSLVPSSLADLKPSFSAVTAESPVPTEKLAYAALASRQLLPTARPADMAVRPSSVQAEVRERVSSLIADELQRNVSTRSLVGLAGSSVSVRF